MAYILEYSLMPLLSFSAVDFNPGSLCHSVSYFTLDLFVGYCFTNKDPLC